MLGAAFGAFSSKLGDIILIVNQDKSASVENGWSPATPPRRKSCYSKNLLDKSLEKMYFCPNALGALLRFTNPKCNPVVEKPEVGNGFCGCVSIFPFDH